MTDDDYGFIGLGNMGKPMADNLAASGLRVSVFDKAGTRERAPDGAQIADSNTAVAGRCRTVFLSLPDGAVVDRVVDEIIESNQRRTETVIDLSTVGIRAARQAAEKLRAAGIGYCDAPVSGGTAGAQAATIALMFAGPVAVLERNRPALSAISKNIFHVGLEPGQGQAMKLLNNFLSATAMAATSEAIAFGEAVGLDMALMCEVLNASSGQNTATKDKFPNRIVPALYNAGFTNTLMSKDVSLFVGAAEETKQTVAIGRKIATVWEQFEKAEPGQDFTRIYPFTKAT